MISNDQLALEMEYCAPRGLSHSHFLGGPDEWTQLDRELALWWVIHERQRCPHCGTRPDEWDPAAGGSLNAYVSEPYSCRGCQVKEGGEEDFGKDKGKYVRGTRPRMKRNPNPDD